MKLSKTLNKSALLCRSLEEGNYDVLVVVETWHNCSESVVLRRIVPPGYQSIDAVRAMPLGTADTQSHGGLRSSFDRQR